MNIVKELKKRDYTIGVMESCTGGALANSITNIPGSSDVFKEGLVTYSNESKIKHGVDQKIIKKFGVYSSQVAEEMARKVEGDVGVGVTGELPGRVYICIVNKQISKLVNKQMNIKTPRRVGMKREVVREVIHMVLKSL